MLPIGKHLRYVGIVLAALALPAFGQNSPWQGGRMDTNLYIGGHVGGATYRNACDGVSTCDDTDTAWKLVVGYQFHRHFAIEAGYGDFGKITGSDTIGAVAVSGDIKATAFEIVAVGLLPVTQELSLYGKIGAARTRLRGNVSASVPGFTFSQSATDHSTDLTFGLGAQYLFTRNIAARAEWQRYDSVGGDNFGKGDIDVFTAGLYYRF